MKNIYCKKCGKRVATQKGDIKVEGGDIQVWCKECHKPVGIFEECQTEPVVKSA